MPRLFNRKLSRNRAGHQWLIVTHRCCHVLRTRLHCDGRSNERHRDCRLFGNFNCHNSWGQRFCWHCNSILDHKFDKPILYTLVYEPLRRGRNRHALMLWQHFWQLSRNGHEHKRWLIPLEYCNVRCSKRLNDDFWCESCRVLLYNRGGNRCYCGSTGSAALEARTS